MTVYSPEDLDGLLTTIGTQGIDVLEGEPKLSSAALKNKFEEEVEPGEVIGLVPPPGALEKTTTTRCPSTCARWVQCLCSPAKGKWILPSASSADSGAC